MSECLTNACNASPISLLRQSSARLCQCSRHLMCCFEAAYFAEWPRAGREVDFISMLSPHVFSSVKKFPACPLTFRDVMILMDAQARIYDAIKNATGLTVEYQVSMPEKIQVRFLEFLGGAARTIQIAGKAIEQTHNVADNRPSGASAISLSRFIRILDEQEKKSNALESDLYMGLTGLEKEEPAIRLVPMKEIVSMLGDITGEAQRMGNRLGLLLS